MEWFRFYHTALDDPKVQCLPPTLFKHWINLLCVASQSTPRGDLPALDQLAFRLRLARPKAQTVLNDLAASGLVDHTAGGGYAIHNWNGRQRASDDVAERVRKSRQRDGGNGPVTLHEPLPETPVLRNSRARDRTEQRQKQIQKNAPPTPSPPTEQVPPTSAECARDRLFSLFCELREINSETIPKKSRTHFEKIFAELMTTYGAADVEGCMRWLQTWRAVPWKPETVVKEIDAWIMNRRPQTGVIPSRQATGPPTGINPAHYRNGGYLTRRGKP